MTDSNSRPAKAGIPHEVMIAVFDRCGKRRRVVGDVRQLGELLEERNRGDTLHRRSMGSGGRSIDRGRSTRHRAGNIAWPVSFAANRGPIARRRSAPVAREPNRRIPMTSRFVTLRRSHSLFAVASCRAESCDEQRGRAMVLEVAPLQIRNGREADFEAAFATAQTIIASMPCYQSHALHRCLERPGEYTSCSCIGIRSRRMCRAFAARRATRNGRRCCTLSTLRSRLSPITSRSRPSARAIPQAELFATGRMAGRVKSAVQVRIPVLKPAAAGTDLPFHCLPFFLPSESRREPPP